MTEKQVKTPEFLKDIATKLNQQLTSREVAKQLDQDDELAYLRHNFHLPKMGTLPEVDRSLVDDEEDSIYLCGNSLGLLPKATRSYVDKQLDKWAEMGVFGHHTGELPWIDCDEAVLDGLQKLVGAEEDEVAAMNGLTVNLHVLLTAFYTPTDKKFKILLESQAFPSDHYAIESQIRLKGYDPKTAMVCMSPREGEDCVRTQDIIDYIKAEGDSIALILFSGVQYYTGQLFDIQIITAAGKAQNCIVGWDLAHAFANVPLELHKWSVDFACWCSYKYGCASAGGLAGLFVHNQHKDDQRNRMLGWWSHERKSRFLMTNELELASGAAGYRISNPPILLVCAVMGFLKAIETTNIQQLRAKSLKLTAYLEYLVDSHFSTQTDQNSKQHIKISLITPRDPSQRGCQLSLQFNCDISLIYRELTKRGCAVDKRYPNVIRVAPVHMYNSFEDCWRFVQVLQDSIQSLNQQKLIKY
ncbi:unnamed protein product [Bursaphelenchus okinawaensis]|uniref:Kynureninase n=1 Tax=Bursaphelenchus okinawaensis TaxID=465554 RepID=A0A811LIK3_9BILA|nr:unnamed protein product [Bursaphelenchus okinawaensis]CAG9123888.1 unnamed protein product [Bursaphelenchus okinawaensis]